MKIGKRIWQKCCVCLCVASLLCSTATAVASSATATVVLDAESGRVLYENQPDKEMLIASTTKIMTALLAIEQGNLQEQVPIRREWTLAEGSSMYLQDGETMSLETLLYGLLLCSGNDAALAVAEHCGGTVEAFVERMNDKAKELGMEHTSFANPSGLDDAKQYSSARDMARLAAYAMENPTFARLVSTEQASIGGRSMHNHNKLLSRLAGCTGLKTGYTKAAGRTLVSCCERNGQRLIVVTLQDGNDWEDHTNLYEACFEQYPRTELCVGGKEAGKVKVEGGTLSKLSVLYADTFAYPLQKGEKVDIALDLPEKVMAPCQAGDWAGEAIFRIDGQEVGRVSLLYGMGCQTKTEEASEPFWLSLQKRLR